MTPVDEDIREFLHAFRTSHDIFIGAKYQSTEVVLINSTHFYIRYTFYERLALLETNKREALQFQFGCYCIDRKFPQKWIGRGDPVAPPSHSADLTPLGFFRLGLHKGCCLRFTITLTELAGKIRAVAFTFTLRANRCVD